MGDRGFCSLTKHPAASCLPSLGHAPLLSPAFVLLCLCLSPWSPRKPSWTPVLSTQPFCSDHTGFLPSTWLFPDCPLGAPHASLVGHELGLKPRTVSLGPCLLVPLHLPPAAVRPTVGQVRPTLMVTVWMTVSPFTWILSFNSHGNRMREAVPWHPTLSRWKLGRKAFSVTSCHCK